MEGADFFAQIAVTQPIDGSVQRSICEPPLHSRDGTEIRPPPYHLIDSDLPTWDSIQTAGPRRAQLFLEEDSAQRATLEAFQNWSEEAAMPDGARRPGNLPTLESIENAAPRQAILAFRLAVQERCAQRARLVDFDESSHQDAMHDGRRMRDDAATSVEPYEGMKYALHMLSIAGDIYFTGTQRMPNLPERY